MDVIAITDIQYDGDFIPKGTKGTVVENTEDIYFPFNVDFGIPGVLFACGPNEVNVNCPMKRRSSFHLNVDGVDAHVLGDPNMAPESRNAVENLIRAAVRYIEDQQPTVSWWSD